MRACEFGLGVMESGVGAGLPQEFLMAADLGDSTALQDHDPIGLAQSAEAMRDGDGRSSTHEVVQRGLDLALGFGVDALVASSKIKILGSVKIARAIEMRWRSPPESDWPRSPTKESYPSGNRRINS